MKMKIQKDLPTAALVLLLTALTACSGRSSAPEAGAGGSAAVTDRQRAQCVMKSPYLQVGAGLDAPGRLEVPVPAVGLPATCKGNTQFRFGSGIYDITGVVANTSGMGWENPAQVFGGIHTRQYARAFAIESPCNGKRVMVIVADLGIMPGALRLHALEAIAADPELAGRYGPDNLMLSATHTHQGPAGYSHFLAHNLLHFGLDNDTFRVTADGIVQALKLADANLRAHPDTAAIRLASGELLDTSIQRSAPAYEMNPEAERREFLNARGEEVRNNKRAVQLNLVRANGSAVGILNWFGVHGTVVGENLKLVSSDNKGYASLGFERIMKTDCRAASGVDSFVAAFPQADQGDASPNIFILERPYPDPTRGGGADDYESNAISGTKHIAKALELYARGAALSGPVDFRLFHVKMDDVEVTDPVVLASLKHPAEMDAAVKRTCSPALGPSFAAGAEDGPGPAVEGVSCSSGLDVIAAAAADFQTLLAIQPPEGLSGFPPNVLPLNLVSAVAMCQLKLLPPTPLLDYSCQAEKPVALPLTAAEPVVLPLQILRLGNLALIGLPWEVPTMSARRIRKQMLDVLAPAGVDTVVIAPLTNDFVHYLPTREEYASQQYEGASDIFGPWTLAAVQQELRKLAITLRDGSPAPDGPDYVDGNPILPRTPYVAGDLPLPRAFGTLVTDVPATAVPGDTITAEFQSGHPRNDLRTQESYVYAERQKADGEWEVVAEDRDPELWFVWKPAIPQPLPIDLPVVGGGLMSTADAVWHIPKNMPAGTYRLRMEGAAQTLVLPKASYTGLSSPFTIAGPVSDCP
ncbi:MAG TPA: neutral/alkaline non-lysosomal ceramidase N-terminal domain-containing protein [Solimonas sp.]|nr:neutral/alkaline non-lysosomal ceramidase N-terminal domain-containing protein [Solimonas sp.]